MIPLIHRRVTMLAGMLRRLLNTSRGAFQTSHRPVVAAQQLLPSSLSSVEYNTSSHHNSAHSSPIRLCPLHHRLLARGKLPLASRFHRTTPSGVSPLTGKWMDTAKWELYQILMQNRGLQGGSNSEVRISFDDPVFREYVLDVLLRYQESRESMIRSDVTEKERQRSSRTVTSLAPVAAKVQEWVKISEDLESIQQLYREDPDREMQVLASSEMEEYRERQEELHEEILELLAPAQPADDNDVIVEFSAGVGGQEAMLFTADLFSMYQKFAAHMRWRFQVLEFDTTELGGLRHATASVAGHQAYKQLKFEAGVHRVQRIPKTERSGRVHTSTMAVAVLPQPKQIDIRLESKDLRVETKRASGAGGQHVNTTDSAVRITHLPTGFVAESQQERSQLKNRQIAMKLLEAKIYSNQLERQTQEERSLRKQQVGNSDRSEKIRTYNYAQDRITDHRLGESVHGVEEFLSGGEMLTGMMESLARQDQREALVFNVEEFIRNRGGSTL